MARTTERREKTDMLIDSCPCPQHLGLDTTSGPRRAETIHAAPTYDGPRPSNDAILVSSTGLAHGYGGCNGLPEYEYLVPPRWGWITGRRHISRRKPLRTRTRAHWGDMG
jgi:hypothetical protein